MATPAPMTTPAESMTLMEMEPNDTILSANEIQLDEIRDDPSSSVKVDGVIEANPTSPAGVIGASPTSVVGANLNAASPSSDVDLFEVQLIEGDILLANIDARRSFDPQRPASSLNSVLTVFDINGNILVQNDNNSYTEGGEIVGGEIVGGEIVIEPDSYQQFTAPENGTYYVGVSSSANLNYDPNVANSGTGASSGSYLLELSFAPVTDAGVTGVTPLTGLSLTEPSLTGLDSI